MQSPVSNTVSTCSPLPGGSLRQTPAVGTTYYYLRTSMQHPCFVVVEGSWHGYTSDFFRLVLRNVFLLRSDAIDECNARNEELSMLRGHDQ